MISISTIEQDIHFRNQIALQTLQQITSLFPSPSSSKSLPPSKTQIAQKDDGRSHGLHQPSGQVPKKM